MARIDLSQLDDFSDDFNQVVTDKQYPGWDAAQEVFVPRDLPVFGQNFEKFESPGLTTTSSTSYINKINATTAALPVGTYRLIVSFNWNSSTISDNFFARFRFDGDKPGATIENDEMMRAEAPDATGGNWAGTGSRQKYPITRVFYVTVTSAGPKSVQLAFRGDDGNQDFSMWDALVEIIRVE